MLTLMKQIAKNLNECKPPCSVMRVREDGDTTVVMAVEGSPDDINENSKYQVWNFSIRIANDFKLYAGKTGLSYIFAEDEYEMRIKSYADLRKYFANN